MTTSPAPLFSTEPFEPLPESDVPEHFVQEVLLRMQRWFEQDDPEEGDEPIPVSRESVESIADWLGGGVRPADELIWPINPAHPWEITGLSLVHRLRLHAVLSRHAYWQAAVIGGDLPADYRQLHEALERTGIIDSTRRDIELASLLVHGHATRRRPELRGIITAWQHHAENPALLRSTLGIGSAPDKSQQDMVTAALGTLIEISEHGPLSRADSVRVAEYAVGPLKSARPIAQRLLALLPDGPALMSAHLAEKKADAREESATWIGRHGTPADADVLQARLEKETDAGVRAALLGALIRLGTSAQQLLSPRALTQESVEHADADASIPSWFSTEQLPALMWADGTRTPASVAPWWLVYADRIGDPIGKGV